MKALHIDHLIFDLGNVMFDWDPKEVANAVLAPEMWEVAHSMHWKEFDRGTVSWDDLIHIFSSKYPKMEAFLNCAKDYLKLKPETFDIFSKCKQKGYSLYILSNMPNFFRNYLIATYPFLSEVHGSIFSCDVGFIKPEKQIYECLLSKFALKANRCLLLDDRPENIESAKALGMQGIVFDNPQNCLNHLLSMKVL